jgi:NAD(P)-dependent dehydrogenase (short-subunit alcohol dehydrogenase family)
MPPAPDLSGRIALVTGASRGIGYFIAKQMAAAGAHVVAVARTVGGLEELDDEIKAAGGTATLVPLDLADMAAIDRLGASIHERWGKLDILVANAGILGVIAPLGHVEAKVFEKVMAINVTSTWRLIRSVDPLLRMSDARPRHRDLLGRGPLGARLLGSLRRCQGGCRGDGPLLGR